jgi:hypothetical protein
MSGQGSEAAEAKEVTSWDGQTLGYASRRLDTLSRLMRDGKITAPMYCAGQLYLSIVESYYASASGLSRLSDEAPHSGGSYDPIQLYTKGRTVYRPTQRPRNVVRPKTSFDGWTVVRCDALQDMKRLRSTLQSLPAESLLALYALVIHPSDPNKRSLSLAAYTIKRYGDKNAKRCAAVTQSLACALDTLHKEYGEPLEQAA